MRGEQGDSMRGEQGDSMRGIHGETTKEEIGEIITQIGMSSLNEQKEMLSRLKIRNGLNFSTYIHYNNS